MGFNLFRNPGAHNRKPPIHRTPWVFSIAFVLLAGIPASLRLYGHPAHINNANLDKEFKPARNFDIVVSVYREDVSHIKSLLTAIRSIRYIDSLNPHVLIYTKDPGADKSYIQKATGADEIKSLDNVGSVPHTYLHHITTNWDTLAAQTLFIPAGVHNRVEFLSRLRTYLNARTGMLPLGPSTPICACNSCTDRSGWSDDLSLLPKLLDGKCGKETNRVLLTTSNQFIASGRRIKGRDKQTYADQLAAMSAPLGEWPHTDPKLKGKPDSLTEPYYAHSLERSWGALLQCSDVDVARRCPTMLGGLLWGGVWGRRVGDCQCLDELAGASEPAA